mmetsp:Transcript_49347/g.127228  ORF Transcript_49347/g.127228 Transcript_49347/m.127228 type:complete len:210 (-) Transcript_49347:414-1043(-)
MVIQNGKGRQLIRIPLRVLAFQETKIEEQKAELIEAAQKREEKQKEEDAKKSSSWVTRKAATPIRSPAYPFFSATVEDQLRSLEEQVKALAEDGDERLRMSVNAIKRALKSAKFDPSRSRVRVLLSLLLTLSIYLTTTAPYFKKMTEIVNKVKRTITVDGKGKCAVRCFDTRISTLIVLSAGARKLALMFEMKAQQEKARAELSTEMQR